MADERILANLIAARAAAMPERDVLTFVHVAADGALLDDVRTYRALWERARRLAAAFEADAIRDGATVALVMQNHPEFVEAMIAASLAAAVFVPIDPRTRDHKLRFMLAHAECEAAVVADYALAALRAVRPSLPKLRRVWVVETGAGVPLAGDERALAAVQRGPVPDVAVRSTDPDAPMQMLFTSGTTGDPKAILASHRRFGEAAMTGGVFGLGPDDRPYTGLSLTHANAQLLTLGSALYAGMRAVISRKFTKSRLWDITRRYGCTVFNLLGGMTVAIWSEPPRPDDADNPVRMVISAGMPAAIWEPFRERFGVEIYEFYGAAEGGLTLNPPGVGPIGSCGKPPPMLELAILDDAGNRCPPGVAGEICFRPVDGSAPEVRYHKQPDASQAKTAGGWLRMGDVGHVDADGWLFFHYRKGGGIRRNGEFVSPGFVEKAIADCAGVADVCVYGVPAASGVPGEQDIVAAVVPSDPARFDPQGVFRHCRRALEPNVVPTWVQVVADIPKTASEKPLERVLRDAFERERTHVHTEAA
jgi:crotonobetaine/carnitine-CoA ligase